MKKSIPLFLVLAGLCSAQMTEISGDRIRAHVKFLASDLLEGRGTGERGGDIATEYVATQFALIGAKPAGDNGTYFQNVPLVGVTTQSNARLVVGGAPLRWLDEFVGVTQQQTTSADFDGDAIFVGHGITAPEYQWDDYKGVDVKGKILVMFTNEPPSTDPKFFDGKALTYYGRWTYKYEEALRKGAVACILIHTTPTAGYGWDVVRNSWGREDPQVKLAPGASALAMAGWISQAAGERLAGMVGKTVDQLLKLADSRDFHPLPLGFRISGSFPAKVRQIKTQNVVARIDGADPQLKSQVVIFSSHWDHLGIGPAVNGDKIYNGAVDNATGCAILIEIARAWASLPQKPRRSAIFLSVTAEEGGLRGSQFYGMHPEVPANQTALDLNFDAFYPWGRTKDVSLGGAERTTVYPTVQDVARRSSLEIKPDPRPEQGSYFRSDHFSFARVGIPAFSIEGGNDYVGKPTGYGDKMFDEYNSKHYHQPSDEYRNDWDVSGMEQIARFGFLLGTTVANDPKMPTWQPGDPFLKARGN